MVNCPTCNTIIGNPRKGQIYCNQECYSKSTKLKEQAKKSKMIKDNSIPTYEERYGKEKAEEMKIKHSNFMKDNPNEGQFNTLKTKGENNFNWKGDDVGYDAIHEWVKRNLGKANHCELCGLKEIPKGKQRFFDWANISDEYKRDINDWVQLCRKCHWKFDNFKKKKPYEVIGVECKTNGYLDKTEKEKCKWLLDNNIFSKILIAYKTKEGRKIVIKYKELE